MLIKMMKLACGADGSFQPGDTREVDERTGDQLIRANAAIDVTPRRIERKAPEITAPAEPEKAVIPTAKAKRK